MTTEQKTPQERIQDLKDEIKTQEDARKATCPFAKGDVVEYKGKRWRVITDPIISSKNEMYVRVRDDKTRLIGWTSNYTFIHDYEFHQAKKIPEPTLDWNRMLRINEDIDHLRSKIQAADRDIVELKSKLQKLRTGCIHDWDEGEEAGEIRKHLVGESEITLYTCKICGAKGRNV